MKYPIKTRDNVEEITKIVDEWPVEVDINHVMKWIMQFDSDDYDLAVRIIKNINIIGAKDLENTLEIAYSKLMRRAVEKGTEITNRNTVFAGIGNDGKSGSMISYHFRLINRISEDNFLSEDTIKYFEQGKIENIVLVDDVLSTGNQASEEIKNITERFTPLGVKNIFVLAACGFKNGIQKVEEDTKAYVFSAYEYDCRDTIISLDSKFYENISYDERKGIFDTIKRYGKVCASGMPLGFGEIGALLVFYYNTPNTTVPLIWGGQNGWIPLFPRVRRIKGLKSFYPKVEKIKAKNRNNNELIIYTEGKTEEVLLDVLVDEFDLTNKLGFEEITIISLGGAFSSTRLLDKLMQSDSKKLFVFEEESRRYIKESEKLPAVFLDPSVIQFIDLHKVYNADQFIFKKMMKREIDSTGAFRFKTRDNEIIINPSDIERYLFKRHRNNKAKFQEALENYINVDAYNKFIEQAKEIIETIKK